MEKTTKGNTITIKIDGKPRPYQEKNDHQKVEEAIKSPNHVDLSQPHAEEHQSKQETAASEEQVDSSFDWILPDADIEVEEIKEYKVASKPKQTNKQKVMNAWGKGKQSLVPSFFFAVFFAVIIGLSFGFILFKMVTTDQATETATTAPTETATGEVAPTGADVTVPAITAHVVQHGAFQTAEGATTKQQELEQKSIPSALVTTDQNYLFIGLASTKEQAKTLGALLATKGVEVYAKEVSLGGQTASNMSDEEQQLLDLASKLYAPLSVASTSLSLKSPIPAEIEASMAELQKTYTSIKSETIKNEQLTTVKTELDAALAIMNSPNSDNSAKLQQHLLNFLSAYQSVK